MECCVTVTVISYRIIHENVYTKYKIPSRKSIEGNTAINICVASICIASFKTGCLHIFETSSKRLSRRKKMVKPHTMSDFCQISSKLNVFDNRP